MSNDEKVVSLNRAKQDNGNKVKSAHNGDKANDFEPVYCSFCGRPNTEVVKMVKGPGVNICSECTMISVQYLILEDKMPSGDAQKILDSFWINLENR